MAKNTIYAIYKGLIYRAANIDESMRIAERVTQRPPNTFNPSGWYFPTAADCQAWFANPNAQGFTIMRALYNDRLPLIPAGSTPKPFEQAVDFRYFLEAIRDIKL